MALQNPNNLYTGGAVVFNTQPSTNFAIQLMAQKKAKDEALDEYYRKLPSTINEAGMRDQDRPGFMQRVSEMQQFYLQNRDAIKDPRRDGGAAQYNFEKLFRGVKGYTEESKTAAKTALELGKLRLNKDFSYVFDDPQTVERIAAHDLPIGTEGRADIDLHTLTIPPKPRSVEDWQRLNTTLTHGLTPGQTPTGKRETLPNFGVREHYVKQFDPQSLQTIGNRTLDMYGTDRDWRGAANQRFAQATPEEIEQLNGIFTAVMKRPMQGPADFFAAEQIVAHSQSTPGYKDTKDTFAEWKAKNAITSAQADARQARSDAKKGDSATAAPTFNDLYRGIDEAATSLRDAYTKGEARTNRLDLSSLPTEQQEEVLKKARNLAADNLLVPADIVLIKGTDERLGIYYARGGNKRIGYLTPTGTNLPVQPSVKEKRNVIQQGNASSQPAPKNTSKPSASGSTPEPPDTNDFKDTRDNDDGSIRTFKDGSYIYYRNNGTATYVTKDGGKLNGTYKGKNAEGPHGVTWDKPKAGKVISKDAFRKMSLAERQQFKANGGTYK
jgi:hypothetical protein